MNSLCAWLNSLTLQQLVALRTQRDNVTFQDLITATREEHLESLKHIKDVKVPVQA